MAIHGKTIEIFRKQKGKTQQDMADLLGIKQSSYSNKVLKGSFDDREIEEICKFLGIKREQIVFEEKEVRDIDFLVAKAIQAEATLSVLLGAMAEVQAKLTNASVTKINADLLAAVNTLTRETLDELRRQAK